MSEQENDGQNKLSVGDIVNSIRSGKQIVPENTQAPPAKVSKPRGRPTAGFWAANLRQSVERRMDNVYESINQDPGAMSQMSRRGFFSSENVEVPLDQVSGVVEMTPGKAPPPLRTPNAKEHEQQEEILPDLSSGEWVVEEVRQVAPKAPKKLSVNPLIRKMFERQGGTDEEQ